MCSNAVDQQVDCWLPAPGHLMGRELNDLLPPRYSQRFRCRVDESFVGTPAVDQRITEIEIQQARGNGGKRLGDSLIRLRTQTGELAPESAYCAMFGQLAPQLIQGIVCIAAEKKNASC